MKYAGMPAAMWKLFAGSFRKQLTAILGYDETAAREMIRKAKPKYKERIARLPEFEKADRFKMNIVNCAMLSAIILSMPSAAGGGTADGFLRKIHVHGPGPLGLPQERQAPIYAEAHGGPESHGRPESGGPESLFLEHGVLRLPGRQRLRSQRTPAPPTPRPVSFWRNWIRPSVKSGKGTAGAAPFLFAPAVL